MKTNTSLVRGLLLFALVAVFVISGCQQKSDMNQPSVFISPEGVKAEVFVDPSAFMMFKFGTSDATQRQNLDNLGSYFPGDGFDMLMKEVTSEFDEDFAEHGVTFEEDLLPAVGENFQLMVSFSGAVSETEDPALTAVLSVADPAAFENWLTKAVGDGNGAVQNYKSHKIYINPDKGTHVVFYKDVIVATNRMSEMRNALERAEGSVDSLLQNASYQKGLAQMPDAIGLFYIDPSVIYEQMQNNSLQTEEMKEQLGEMADILKAIDGEIFAFTAEPDGIRMHGLVYGDPEKWEALQGFLALDMDPIYLYEQVPGEGTMLYSESFNAKENLNTTFAMYKNMPEFDEMMQVLDDALAEVDLDFKDDILSFMDRGLAYSLRDTGSIIPSIGFYVDARSNREGAEKVMNVIFESIVDALSSDPELESFISHKKFSTKGGDSSSLVLDISSAPDVDDIPKDLLQLKPAFNYGVNADGLAFFEIVVKDDGGAPLAQNSSFKRSLDNLKGYEYGVAYLDVEQFMTYVNRVVDFAMGLEGGSADDLVEYEIFKSYVSPVKSIIFASKKPEVGQVQMQGFIEISSGDYAQTYEACIHSCEIQAVGKEMVDQCIANCDG